MSHEEASPGTKVGIWTRTSRLGQDPSIAAQAEVMRIMAEGMKWDIRELYSLENVSDDDLVDHPENQRLLADIRSGHVELFMAYSMDHMTTHNRDILALFEEVHRAGARMMTLEGYFT
jgi:DNA invertase Pin-like site-specific DNA recombinase